MRRFRKGGYPLGGLVAVDLFGHVLLGTVCEFASNGKISSPDCGEYRIKPLRKEAKKTHWVDADMVWSLSEIRRRQKYLKELRELVELYPLGLVNELIRDEIVRIEKMPLPEETAGILERAEKERKEAKTCPDGG